MVDPASMSPMPKKEEVSSKEGVMDFFAALVSIMEGKKVHKLEWEDKRFYGFLNGEILSLHKPDGNNYQWIISIGDMKGTDYITI